MAGGTVPPAMQAESPRNYEKKTLTITIIMKKTDWKADPNGTRIFELERPQYFCRMPEWVAAAWNAGEFEDRVHLAHTWGIDGRPLTPEQMAENDGYLAVVEESIFPWGYSPGVDVSGEKHMKTDLMIENVDRILRDHPPGAALADSLRRDADAARAEERATRADAALAALRAVRA